MTLGLLLVTLVPLQGSLEPMKAPLELWNFSKEAWNPLQYIRNPFRDHLNVSKDSEATENPSQFNPSLTVPVQGHVTARIQTIFNIWRVLIEVITQLQCFSSSFSPTCFPPHVSLLENNEVIIALICFFCSVNQMPDDLWCVSNRRSTCPAGPYYCPHAAFREHGEISVHWSPRYNFTKVSGTKQVFCDVLLFHFLFCLLAPGCCRISRLWKSYWTQ